MSGFKSFVDPITIPIEGNLIGIVGPNGCGKSNIIDAVRWVMGESSAKHLRGDSMADVIFSGSTARKPVGKATVELIFDNSEGKAPGQYAAYNEISIRREAGRDGQSDYFLNRTKCRRKDITDLFLGTGLGPHSYSILEQNAVTRIIESKPEDLRGFFEEAAGVSRYKERRRETENRIRHTRENLSRVEDIRKELDTQLQRLQRQSRSAQRYKELKQEERLVHAQLLGLRWLGLNKRVQEHDTTLARHETELQGVLAGLRSIEAEIEKTRVAQTEANDHFNGVQAEFYAAGAEIAGIEQSIQHVRDTHQERQREHDQINQSWDEASRHLQEDMQRLEALRQSLESGAPQLTERRNVRASGTEALSLAEQAMQTWQATWENFGQTAAEPDKTRQVQSARIQSLRQHITQLQERQTRLSDEIATIETELNGEDLSALRVQVEGRDKVHEAQERALEALEAGIKETRANSETVATRLEEQRGKKQNTEARLASLQELQAAALGKHDAALNDWLRQRGLHAAPRLAGQLQVEPGWEKAVERVLGAHLTAVCVPQLDKLTDDIEALSQAELTVFETNGQTRGAQAAGSSLLSKVSSAVDISTLLSGIYVAEDLASALAQRTQLAAHESVVTRSGIWVGKNWIAVTDEESARAGMLGREREMETLKSEFDALQQALNTTQEELTNLQRQLQAQEQEREEQRRKLNDFNRERAGIHAQLGHKEARLAQLGSRRQQIQHERDEITAQLQTEQAEQENAEKLLREAESQTGTLEERRAGLLRERDSLRTALEQARAAVAQANESLHQLEVERQGLQTAFESTGQGISRLENQLKQLTQRKSELAALLAQEEQPEAALKQRLEEFLKKRLEIENRLNAARQAVADLDASLRQQQQARTQQEHKIQGAREVLEQERIARQELAVRAETIDEQVRESEFDLQQVLQEIPADAVEETWQQRQEELAGKISRLGPINLVAIEEYDEQSERKGYLDKQSEDLSQALATLEDAIRKIDRETRTRFKETFDKVNTGFQNLFPRLFGGGHAYLELMGEEILDTGVRVMARPPGKRNSTIHLLSGGEKALTAVSLLFALFELNPAPFCLLDEVDAPLDDANVIRYSDLLKVLSQKTQLIYITHNKISMEIAQVLVGVTMSEPGVSRLVAVDVEGALEMVAQ